MQTNAAVAVFVLYTAVVGCGDGGRAPAAEPTSRSPTSQSPTQDTNNAHALDGLSREQLDRRAEPMSPEKAERLGLPTLDPDSARPSAP